MSLLSTLLVLSAVPAEAGGQSPQPEAVSAANRAAIQQIVFGDETNELTTSTETPIPTKKLTKSMLKKLGGL